MRLRTKIVPYSSIVGGGLQLLDEKGRAVFIVNFIGTAWGISKDQTASLSEQLSALIEAHGLFLPDFIREVDPTAPQHPSKP